MANWVEAGPGSRFVADMPSSNSCALSHPRSSTQSLRKQRDVGGRSAEADDADATPLAHDDGKWHALFDGLGHGRREVDSNGSRS